jgi:hypothetical protein
VRNTFPPPNECRTANGSTSEGGGELHSPPQKIMDQWLYSTGDKATPLAMHNGLAWWNRESEEPAISGMWDTIYELDRDIVAPKKSHSYGISGGAYPRHDVRATHESGHPHE